MLNQRRLSILFVRTSFLCEAMVLPFHSLPPASLLCYQLPPVLEEFPRSALFEMEVQILYLCLGTSLALDSGFFCELCLAHHPPRLKRFPFQTITNFPAPPYSDTFGTWQKLNCSQIRILL